MAKILGIDLGTTNSAMAIIDAGEPTILENSEGARTTPSVVAISKTGERLVGQVAKRQAVTNPSNTIYGIKRFMGHSASDKIVQENKGVLPYEIKEGSDGGILVKLGDKDQRPEEISAMILSKLKSDAEAKLGETITEAIITVPAYFDDAQRKATKDAGKIAGLEVKRIINEPTAAALAYGFNKKKDEKIVVFDFGGGTFDVSVLEVGDEVIEVKASDGDAFMGGRDIDQKIIDWIATEFKKSEGIDLLKDPLAVQRLDEAAEKAKHELSTTTQSEINIPFVTSDANGPKHLLLTLNRSKLEELARPHIDKAIDITKRALEASPFKISDIDEIILVGGQTRMPAIQEAVKSLFGKEPNRTINPDEVVALGAAIQAGIMQGDVKDILLLDVIPLSLGIETMGGVATKLIERNTTIPTSKSQIFSTAADNQTSVEVHILQGERAMAADNKSLGRFILEGIPPAPRGVPQVEVSLDVDANGILKVTARDKTSGKEQSVRIEASSGLTDADIEKMQKDAETHADEDKKKKELADARNLAESIMHTAEKSLKEHEAIVTAELKADVESKIQALRTAIAGNDHAAITSATEGLNAALPQIGEAVSKHNETKADAGNTSGDQASNNAGEGVHDVDATEGENTEGDGADKK